MQPCSTNPLMPLHCNLQQVLICNLKMIEYKKTDEKYTLDTLEIVLKHMIYIMLFIIEVMLIKQHCSNITVVD